MKTLIVGCSFCNNLIWDYHANKNDWERIQTETPLYEWAILDPTQMIDRIHPSRDAMREWILGNFKLDITG